MQFNNLADREYEQQISLSFDIHWPQKAAPAF